MSTVTIKSYRKEREKEIIDGLQKGLEKAGLIVERQAKINVTQSPPKHPQVQTGRLRASITHNVSPGEVEIGSNVVYSKYLEFGTSKMSPHPFLFPAVELKKPQIIEALKGHEFVIE
jgi:HK97 gp10 family phage protein